MDRTTKAVVALSIVTVVLLLITAGALIALRPIPPSPAAHSPLPSAHIDLPVIHIIPASRLRVAYAPLIEDAAARNNLSPMLVAAVTRVESDFDPLEISNKGARGLMQVMPETGMRFGVRPEHLLDPERNIAAGTAYLSWLLDRYDGDLDLALAGYNAGEGAVDRYRGIPPYRETRDYVRKVRRALSAMQR